MKLVKTISTVATQLLLQGYLWKQMILPWGGPMGAQILPWAQQLLPRMSLPSPPSFAQSGARPGTFYSSTSSSTNRCAPASPAGWSLLGQRLAGWIAQMVLGRLSGALTMTTPAVGKAQLLLVTVTQQLLNAAQLVSDVNHAQLLL